MIRASVATIVLLCCGPIASCSSDPMDEGKTRDPATGDDAGEGADESDAATNERDAAAGDSAQEDAAVAARACNATTKLAFQAQRAYPSGTSFDSAFDCGSSGHLLHRGGPPENRVNLVILGDGYRQSELASLFQEHATRLVTHMFSAQGEPYLAYEKYFNVCSLDVASKQSGTDIPDENVQVDTAFDGNGSDGTRLGLVDDDKVMTALDTLLADTRIDPDLIAVTLNVNRWFNSGGRLMIWSGARPGLPDVALHEGGHAFHALADEYGGNPGVRYKGQEVRELNVSVDASGARWKEWLGYDQPGVGKIGAYEGGRYYDLGIYRPSPNSKMNQVPALHNAPSMQKIVHDIYRLVRPVDAWTENGRELDNPCSLELTLVDPARVEVLWSVDGVAQESDSGSSFDALNQLSEAGVYQVSARVYDPTTLVRNDRAALEQTITWSVRVP